MVSNFGCNFSVVCVCMQWIFTHKGWVVPYQQWACFVQKNVKVLSWQQARVIVCLISGCCVPGFQNFSDTVVVSMTQALSKFLTFTQYMINPGYGSSIFVGDEGAWYPNPVKSWEYPTHPALFRTTISAVTPYCPFTV